MPQGIVLDVQGAGGYVDFCARDGVAEGNVSRVEADAAVWVAPLCAVFQVAANVEADVCELGTNLMVPAGE